MPGQRQYATLAPSLPVHQKVRREEEEQMVGEFRLYDTMMSHGVRRDGYNKVLSKQLFQHVKQRVAIWFPLLSSLGAKKNTIDPCFPC